MGGATLKWRREGVIRKERGGQASSVSEKSRKTRPQNIARCHFSLITADATITHYSFQNLASEGKRKNGISWLIDIHRSFLNIERGPGILT